MRQDRLLRAVARLGKDVITIGANERGARRLRMLAAYAKLQLAARSRRSGAGRLRRLGILGYVVHYPDPTSLMVMLREIFIEKHYDFQAQRANPLIIDAGANIGLATLYLKERYPRARVIAIEPDPLAFEGLKRNMMVNKIENVVLLNEAVADTDGMETFYSTGGSLVASLENPRDLMAHMTSVRTRRLSSLIQSPVDLLKLDVEGMELSVIEELSTAGKLSFVRTLICEYHHNLPHANRYFSRFLACLETADFGYQVRALTKTPFQPGAFQDLLVFAYRRLGPPTTASPQSQ